mmetsp:Transcript_31356/g.73921  ORF Transcript_31356/g.73921 Transcript_31356/m.73921 type:complete len:334 (+) Transcript_31356:179-1180(+)
MRAAGLALISLCLGISLMPGLALTSVESGLPATGTSPARPVTLLRPVLALKETLRRNQLFEVLRSSESPVVSRARDCGVSIGRLILQLVQFAAIFVFNVAGCFVGMCWWLSPDSTIFGLFELHTEDDGNKIPAPLTTNSKRALAVCLVCSIALPIGTNVWELYKHIANTTMSTPLEDSSATATTETPTLQETSAPSTREPRIFSSLLLRGISGVLGGLGFLLLSFLFANVTLGRVIDESTMRSVLGRIFESLTHSLRTSHIPPTVLIILVPMLVLATFVGVSLLFCIPTYCVLNFARVLFETFFGLGWVVWAALNLFGALAFAIASILVLNPQ